MVVTGHQLRAAIAAWEEFRDYYARRAHASGHAMIDKADEALRHLASWHRTYEDAVLVRDGERQITLRQAEWRLQRTAFYLGSARTANRPKRVEWRRRHATLEGILADGRTVRVDVPVEDEYWLQGPPKLRR